MRTLQITLNDETIARLTEVSGRHGVTTAALAASIVENGVAGEDMKRELRRLRVDIAMVAQAFLVGTGLEPDHDEAWAWARRELLMNAAAASAPEGHK